MVQIATRRAACARLARPTQFPAAATHLRAPTASQGASLTQRAGPRAPAAARARTKVPLAQPHARTSAPNQTGARRAARRRHRARPAPTVAAKDCSVPSSAPNVHRMPSGLVVQRRRADSMWQWHIQRPAQRLSVQGASRVAECQCNAGYYNERNALGTPKCILCGAGAACKVRGVTVATLPLKAGYWRLSPESTEIKRCPDAAHGSDSACVGGDGTSTPAKTRRQLGSSSACRESTTGPYCQLCDDEATVGSGSRLYYSRSTRTCKECTGDLVAPISTAVGIAVVLAGLGALYYVYMPHRRVPWLRMLLLRGTTMVAAFSLRAKAKQCVGFYQVATSVATVYNVVMPASTQSLLDTLQFVNLNLFDAFGLPYECLSLHGFSSQLRFHMLAPLGLVTVITLGCVGSQLVQLLRGRAGGVGAPSGACAPSWRWKLVKRGLLKALPAISVISFLVFPAVSTVAFRAWD
eukprot:scaffold788_cov74-Phaeocystis_antarctica.AAC.1